MESNEKINVRGAIAELEVGGEALVLPKEMYLVSSVRATAASLTADTGRKFNVSATDRSILIKRVE